ncbi:MAG: translation initiation factor IF-2, partial [Thermoguttaceae bacterium]
MVQLPCTVKQFAEMTGLSVAIIIRKLMEFGTPLMINSLLDKEVAELLSVEFGLKVEIRDEVSLEQKLVTSLFETEDDPSQLQPRPPVVTFLGHVDHGKTSLLDRILNLNVVSGEKGGITQHIRAYRIPTSHGGDVTFVDTPGHEAFTEMRARGANCTDIAVLVVAVDDGVMPQTEEAISHAKAANVPIVVALNKIDLPNANPDKAIQGIAANELIPSEWGGDVEIVKCSAITGEGIDELMATLLMVAELHELKANPNRSATGVVLESELQAGQGVVCKALVQNGTLKTGDVVLCGNAYGRVKTMYDTLDPKKIILEAPPSTPVNLVGLDIAPTAGSKFCVLEDISEARRIAEERDADFRKMDLAGTQTHITLENLFQRINQATSTQTLNIILRADVRGSIEAIRKELGKLEHPEVKLKILQASVGGITEADVQLADASDAIIVGFNVVPDENARSLADKKKIQVRRYDIIYKLSADIKAALEGLLKPLEQVRELGRAYVQRVYSISRLGTIAGCRVINGFVERDSKIRIIRESRIIGEYPLDSLKREKDDAKEVREGYECGMKL